MKYIILILVMAACSPSSQLRRANKLISKAEAAGLSWSIDTVFKETTFFIPQTRVDSIFKTTPGDTVILQRERLKVVYIRLPGDSVLITGSCDSVTIIKEVPVTITKVISAPKSNWWRALLIGIGIGAFAVVIALIALRR